MDWILLLVIIGLVTFIFWLLKTDKLTSARLQKYIFLLLGFIAFLILLLLSIGNSY